MNGRKVLLVGALLLSLSACEERSKRMRVLPVDELVRKHASLEQEPVRASGTLVPGSLRRRSDPCETELELRHGGTVLPVRYSQCAVPETLRELPGVDVELVAEGILQADGRFEARALNVRVPELLATPPSASAPSGSSK
jgi:cytochrome c-type biogenesis protein CcmE